MGGVSSLIRKRRQKRNSSEERNVSKPKSSNMRAVESLAWHLEDWHIVPKKQDGIQYICM